MKKALAILLTLITVLSIMSLSVSARTLTAGEQGIFDKLREGVQTADGKFYLPEATIVGGENYQKGTTAEYQLTQAQVDEIMRQIDLANQAVIDSGTGNAYKWTSKTRVAVLTAIDNAAKQIIVEKGLPTEHTLRARGRLNQGVSSIQVYDPEKTVAGVPDADVLVQEEHLIQKTGTDYTAFVVAGVCGIVLLSACVVVSKKVQLF